MKSWLVCRMKPKTAAGKVAIEIKGEGGYCVAPGSLHPSGRRYQAIAGDFANIPTVPQAVADALIAAARKLDEAPLTRKEREAQEAREAAAKTCNKYRAESNGQGSIIDAYNGQVKIESALESHGYTRSGPALETPRRQVPERCGARWEVVSP